MPKPLHGQFLGQSLQTADSKNRDWQTAGGLKTETGGFLTAIQDRALRTNANNVKLDKQLCEVMCIICNDREETEDTYQLNEAKLHNLYIKIHNTGWPKK